MHSLLLNMGLWVATWIAPIIFGIVFVTIFVTVIVNIFKKTKKFGQISKTIEDSIIDNFNQAKAEVEESRNPHITCEYCGSLNDKTSKSCANCGASLKIKKK